MNISMQVTWVVTIWHGDDQELDDQELHKLRPSALVEKFFVKIEAVWASLWDQRHCLRKGYGTDRDRLLEQMDLTADTLLKSKIRYVHRLIHERSVSLAIGLPQEAMLQR